MIHQSFHLKPDNFSSRNLFILIGPMRSVALMGGPLMNFHVAIDSNCSDKLPGSTTVNWKRTDFHLLEIFLSVFHTKANEHAHVSGNSRSGCTHEHHAVKRSLTNRLCATSH